MHGSLKSKKDCSDEPNRGKSLARFWDKRQIAEYLGISIYTVDAWVSQKRIPYIKLGGKKVVFDRKEIEKWIDDQKVEPVRAKELDIS